MTAPAATVQPTDDVEPIRIQLDSALDALEKTTSHPDDRPFLDELRRAARGEGLRLPQLPEDLARIRLVMADPDAGPRELARAIRHNPVVAAQFVALANSAFFSGNHKIEHLDEAVVRVGMRQAVAWVTAIVAKSTLFISVGYRSEAKALFQHSLATAVNAQLIADVTFPERSPDAFVTGLIHDFGRVYILAVAGGQDLVRSMNRGAPSPSMLERSADALHAGFSGLIARGWAFDRTVVSAILDHHADLGPIQPDDPDALRLARIIQTSDDMGHQMVDSVLEIEELEPSSLEVLDAFDAIDELLVEAQDAFAAFESALS